MTEFLAVYNEDDVLLDEKIDRKDRETIENDKYFRIVIVFIQNSRNEFLIQKVPVHKGDCFATTGGHVQYNVSSLDTIVSEVEEELGTTVVKEEFQLIATNKRWPIFQDVYYLKKDIDISKLTLQETEVVSVEWMSIDKIKKVIEKGQLRKSNIEAFKQVLENITK